MSGLLYYVLLCCEFGFIWRCRQFLFSLILSISAFSTIISRVYTAGGGLFIMHTYIHTHAHTQSQTNTPTHTPDTHTHQDSDTDPTTHPHRHADIHRHTDTDTHTQKQTNLHFLTKTHTLWQPRSSAAGILESNAQAGLWCNGFITCSSLKKGKS